MKHIIKKTITLMLTIIMAMGMMTFGSSKIEADDNIITSVTVNVPTPRVGESPGMPLVAEDQPYMRVTYTWAYSLETGLVIPANHVFSSEEIGKTVYVYIGLSALEGSAFSDSLSVSEITIPGVKEIISIDVREYTLDIIASFEVQEDVSAVTEYRLWVGGNRVTSKYLSNTEEGWNYDPDSNTLYLSNADITGTFRDGSCIYVATGNTLTVSLSGNNKVTSKDVNSQGFFVSSTDLLITGEGSLTIDVKEIGIQAAWASIKIKDTVVAISTNDEGIPGAGILEIENSTVTISAPNDGIWLGSTTITDSKVDVTAGSLGLYVSGQISISGDSYVSSDTTGGDSDVKYAMIAKKPFVITGLDIIEPEEGKITDAVIPGFGQDPCNFVSDKDGNIAAKAIIAKTYTIRFVDEDGTLLQEKKTPVYEVPKYEGDTPAKESDGRYTYTFKGWDRQITEVKGDATYTAVYDKTPIETPEPEPKPVMPFSIPKTGIEGLSSSHRLISMLGVCTLGIFLTRKKHS